MSDEIIKKEISWDEFTAFLFESTVLENAGYCFAIDSVRLENDKIEILNGPYVWNCFYKEDNEIVKYRSGSFILKRRRHDEKEVGKHDDGYPIYEELETYKIVNAEITLHQLKTL